MPDSSSPRQESSAELKVSSGEIVSSYNPHTPALPCSPQQQRLLSHLEGSTALVHTQKTLPWPGMETLSCSICSEPGTTSLCSEWRKANSSRRAIHQPKVPMAQDEPSGKCSTLSLPQTGLNLTDCSFVCILVPLFPRTEQIYCFTRSPWSYCSFPGGCSPTYSVLFALTALPDRIQTHTRTSCKALTPT